MPAMMPAFQILLLPMEASPTDQCQQLCQSLQIGQSLKCSQACSQMCRKLTWKLMGQLTWQLTTKAKTGTGTSTIGGIARGASCMMRVPSRTNHTAAPHTRQALVLTAQHGGVLLPDERMPIAQCGDHTGTLLNLCCDCAWLWMPEIWPDYDCAF